MVTDHLFSRARSNGHCVGIRGDLRQGLRSVCVVGAGAAGLCALRHFTSRPEQFGPIVCFEQSDAVGGTWNYSEGTGVDQTSGLPVHSSMYRDLHTNLPIQIMEFPDFPATNCTESYVHHTEVQHYLQSYSAHFNLDQFVHFRHHLKLITRDSVRDCWQITVENILERRCFTQEFDILILCPGRHSVPNWPQIKSIHQFNGRIIHSHDYRCREPYTGQRVAVIGGGPSGVDIALEISKVADDVFFINRTKHFRSLPENVHQMNSSLVGFRLKSVLIREASDQIRELEVDSVILATGYRFNLDYLDQDSCGIRWNQDDTIDGLYRHLVNAHHPSMILMGVLQRSVLPFPLYHQQLQYYIRLLESEFPTLNQMIQESQQELAIQKSKNPSGFRTRDRHCFSVDSLIQYLGQLERDARIPALPPVKLRLFRDIELKIRTQNILGYKRISYKLTEDGESFVQSQ